MYLQKCSNKKRRQAKRPESQTINQTEAKDFNCLFLQAGGGQPVESEDKDKKSEDTRRNLGI